MKVVLLNRNTAVSRLISLSVNKLGYQFLEVESIEELPQEIDLLVADDEIDNFDSNLTKFAKHTIFLVSKNIEELPQGGEILQKPFLPTRFIEIVESFKTDESVDNIDLSELGLDDEVILEDIPDESDMKVDDLIKTANSELDETGGIEQIVNLVNEIDQMDEEDGPKNEQDELLDESKLDEISQDLPDEGSSENLEAEKNIDENIADRKNVESDEDILADQNVQENLAQENLEDDLVSENSQETMQTEQDIQNTGIDQIQASQDDGLEEVEEIEEVEENVTNDENIQTDEVAESAQIDEVVTNDESIENNENLSDEKLESEILDSGLNDEIQAILSGEGAQKESEEETQDDILEEISENLAENDFIEEIQDVDEQENLKQENISQQGEISTESNIDNLKERDIKIALNEEVSDLEEIQSVQKESENLKSSIAEKISNEIHSNITESSIKEVLKDMKININITFEDKS